jgi:glucokinase
MTEEIVLACDLGGTNLRMAAVNARGGILHRLKVQTPKTERASEIVSAIAAAANECFEKAQELGDVKALAVAAPAIVNAKEGITLKAPNVPALDGFRLSAALSSELNLPVVLENDANAAAVGEQTFGAGRGFQNAIAVTLGTGVGGGIIINGQILQGVDGTAGEIGHICVEPFGVPCGCGSRGCLEQYSSATAMVRLASELENQYPKTVLQNKSRLTSADIYQAGKERDELALEVFRQMGFYLGVALADLVNVLNPEVIIIGGGASAGWDLFIGHVQEQIRTRAFREPAERVKIVRAVLGDDAGILGVTQLAFLN